MGAPRAIEIARGLYAIVADAPAARYNQVVIERNLTDLDWVSRAAVAHEGVVEHFIDARAVLPMKLFTIFANDDRAVAHLRRERLRLSAVARRVAGQHEWGVRVLLDSSRAVAEPQTPVMRAKDGADIGAAYLLAKKVRRDAAEELAMRARRTAAGVYERLAKKARAARKRMSRDLPSGQGTLLLDAAFLVARNRQAAFRAAAAKEAKGLAPKGYAVTLTGPWPPYTFVQD
jgi:Gas vesicle synthesis protein GvpL/GvpF